MRRHDWPERLAASIRTAKSKAFSDDYYCVTFAADCVLAMTDVDYLADYRGQNMEVALENLKAAGHSSFYHYMVKTFGKPIPVSKAQRGDVIIRTKPEVITGICCGQNTAYPIDEGLTYYPTLEQRWCFPVR
jgi:hypothetical protein